VAESHEKENNPNYKPNRATKKKKLNYTTKLKINAKKRSKTTTKNQPNPTINHTNHHPIKHKINKTPTSFKCLSDGGFKGKIKGSPKTHE